MEKTQNQFDGFLKDKKIATKKEEVVIKEKTVDDSSKVKKTSSFRERALVRVKNMYLHLKKALQKSGKFGFFVFSFMLFIAGPAYIHYLNTQLFNYIKINGGLRREGAGGAGMRPY